MAEIAAKPLFPNTTFCFPEVHPEGKHKYRKGCRFCVAETWPVAFCIKQNAKEQPA